MQNIPLQVCHMNIYNIYHIYVKYTNIPQHIYRTFYIYIYISYISYISYIMNEVKPLENVNKNPQRFLEISSIQTELAPL